MADTSSSQPTGVSLGSSSVHHSLRGHSAPLLEETYAADLEVFAGTIPPELSGSYVRNGGNPHIPPRPGQGYHLFEGSGMIHRIHLDPKNQRATYTNRWVRTERFKEEVVTGKRNKESNFDYRGGVANTSLVFHAGKLLALEEGHLPHHLFAHPDGDISTQGYEDFAGRLEQSFTAHPKLDTQTGELLFFGYNLMQKPYCTYGVVNGSGELVTSVPLDYETPVMIHDMAISQKYSVIMVSPLEFSLEKVMKGEGMPFAFEKSHPSRFAVIPRHATSSEEIIWVEDPVACYGFHTANAWDDADGETVHFVLCGQTDFDLGFGKKYAPEDTLRMFKFSLHLPSRTVKRTTVFNRLCEFPSMNPHFVGREGRFAYPINGVDERVPAAEVPDFRAFAAENSAPGRDSVLGKAPFGWSVSKIDIARGCESGRIVFGDNRHVGECTFVPKAGATAEDAGYLVTILHDAAAGTSSFAAFDAETMSSEPVCVVRLPVRVPFGFHGTWLSQTILEQQASWQPPVLREPLHRSPVAAPLPARL